MISRGGEEKGARDDSAQDSRLVHQGKASRSMQDKN